MSLYHNSLQAMLTFTELNNTHTENSTEEKKAKKACVLQFTNLPLTFLTFTSFSLHCISVKCAALKVKDKISSGESKVGGDKTVLKETLVVPQWSWVTMLRQSRIGNR